jgi:hypothetical protein
MFKKCSLNQNCERFMVAMLINIVTLGGSLTEGKSPKDNIIFMKEERDINAY